MLIERSIESVFLAAPQLVSSYFGCNYANPNTWPLSSEAHLPRAVCQQATWGTLVTGVVGLKRNMFHGMSTEPAEIIRCLRVCGVASDEHMGNTSDLCVWPETKHVRWDEY